jgi:hypothetical protein
VFVKDKVTEEDIIRAITTGPATAIAGRAEVAGDKQS